MPRRKSYAENNRDRTSLRDTKRKVERRDKKIKTQDGLIGDLEIKVRELEVALKERDKELALLGGNDVGIVSDRVRLPEGEELADILKGWAEEHLIIPHGELQGKKFKMADFQYKFIKNTFKEGISESLLCIPRKNAKSSLIAIFFICVLAGPLNVPNFRATVVSLTGNLANELRMLIMNFFEASPSLSPSMGEYTFNATPKPGHIIGQRGARVDFLSADRGSGHAVGADLAIIDELGLIGENQRELVDAAFSSLGSRNGRLLALSIRGDGPHLQEMLDRQALKHVYIQHHCLEEGDDPYDESNWHKANPGLSCGIKSLSYMRSAGASPTLGQRETAPRLTNERQRHARPTRDSPPLGDSPTLGQGSRLVWGCFFVP